MFKREHILAVGSFLLIPVVTILAALLLNLIDPEIAAGYPNYERNFQLLNMVKSVLLFAALLVNMALWFLTCFFLVKSRQQSYKWLPLALLGPLGLIGLTMLRDNAPASGDLYQRCVSRQKIYLRVVLELSIFVVVWVVAFQAMIVKRDLMIAYQAATTGMSTADIINQQNASSGMNAFSEGLEVLYWVVFFYLLWPICFNVITGQLPKHWTAAVRT